MRLLRRWGVLALLPVALFAGCSDDDGSEPDLITIADFAGSWETLTYRVTNSAIPAISLEIISLGAAMEWEADEAGQFTGSAFIPAALAGQDLELDVGGTFSLISQDSVVINFVPEYPPFLTQTRAEFELTGNLLSFTDEDSTFDFDGDGIEEAAIFEGTFVRS
jgi:hypothetical protein